MLNSYHRFAASRNLYPKAIIDRIREDYEFMESIGIDSSMHISIPGHDTSFERHELFDAIMKLQKAESTTLKDRNANEWTVKVSSENRDVLEIDFEEQHVAIEGFTIPALSQVHRSELISQLCNFNLLSSQDKQYWIANLSDGEINPDSTFKFYELLKCSVPNRLRKIKTGISSGTGRLTDLVPKSDEYFESLVGKYDNSKDISEYSKLEAQKHIEHMIGCDRLELLVLYLQHISLTEQVSKLINEQQLSGITQSANLLNPLHLVGLAELSFLNKKSAAKTDEILEKFFNTKLNSFDLLSSTFILVYSEMGANRILADKPAYYRRLAALSHTSMLFDFFSELQIDSVDFQDAAKESWGAKFIFQILFELDSNPRWFPDYITGDTIKQDFIGRIYNASQNSSNELKELLSKRNSENLKDGNPDGRTIESFLPSPIEGNLPAQQLDQNFSSLLKERLRIEAFEIRSLAPIINLAAYFKVDESDVDELVNKLRDSQRKVSSTTAQSEVHFVLSGLSRLACITKSTELAQEFRVVFRVYRGYLEIDENIPEVLIYGVIASASFDECSERAEFIGSWVSELAYLKIKPEHLSVLHSWLYEMCKVDPKLFHYCGKSLAALEQFQR